MVSYFGLVCPYTYSGSIVNGPYLAVEIFCLCCACGRQKIQPLAHWQWVLSVYYFFVSLRIYAEEGCNQCTIVNICFSSFHPCRGRGCWMIRIYTFRRLTYFSHSFLKNKKFKKRTFVYIAEIFQLVFTLFQKIESLKITLLFTFRKYSIWKLYIYI